MRILLAEDDDLLGSGLRAGLAQHGFAVDWVRDGVAAERELLTGNFQAAVLDLGLPRQDGMDTLRAVRAQQNRTPVLILTARDAIDARIHGLDGGADDYIVKPVDLGELAARLRALIRRAHGEPSAQLTLGNLRLDTAARQVWQGDELVDLSGREFNLLQVFLLNADRVLTREQLEQQIYKWGSEVSSNAVEVHVHNLRRKLGPSVIETVRGVGYVSRRPAG
ncbi:response regulator [Ottowia oryzae]|uniref:DNA-binding response regulator n=1 Tax=Ottowia oryzae TaxID=2109914 RepID=A0A2S0MHI1_9BURK|nr:response regulator [Ottowia oryzae]AVO35338.1 DNA-binding response regulator [Ottowia oryzae]